MKTLYCSRCGIPVGDESALQGEMTRGFYIARGWQKYCDHDDVYVCDRCMWCDYRYREDYNSIRLNPCEPLSLKERIEDIRESCRDFLRLIGWYRKHHHAPRTKEVRKLG